MWVYYVIAAVIALYTYSRIPKPQNAKRPGINDIQGITADPSRDRIVIFGTVDIPSANITWYGGYRTVAIKEKVKKLFGSKKVTVGWKIYLSFEAWICRGPVDKVFRFSFDNKRAWTGSAIDEKIYINQPGLFGGEKEEGGIVGYIDIRNGHKTQTASAYMVSQIGTDIPASRGMLSIVAEDLYIGTSRYLKAFKLRVSRIHVRQDGIDQWYDAKAAIGSSSVLVDYQSEWYYKLESPGSTANYSAYNYYHGGWAVGQGVICNTITSIYDETVHTVIPGSPGTMPGGHALWLRGNIPIPLLAYPQDLYITVIADNIAEIWVNGVFIQTEQVDTYYWRAYIPASILLWAQSNIVALKVIDTGGYIAGDIRIENAPTEMNPAHIIREALTDPDWGMGYPESDMNEAFFQAAADTLYDEELGLSLSWDSRKEIGEFILDILEHIDGNLYCDRSTGEFCLTLVRNDYTPSSLLHLDESHVVAVEDYSETVFGEFVNTVSVTYNDQGTEIAESVTFSDTALAQLQGGRIETERHYPGVRNAMLASRLAERDQAALSQPLASCTVIADRTAASLNLGDPFRLSWAEYDLAEVVFRVQEMSFGDYQSNQIKMKVLQDVFFTPTTPLISAPPESGNVVLPEAEEAEAVAIEMPYFLLAEFYGQGTIDAQLSVSPDIGYTGLVVGRPSDDALGGQLYFSTDGVTYTSDSEVEFAPFAQIIPDSNGVLSLMDTHLVLSAMRDFDEIALPAIGMIGDEFIYISALSYDNASGYYLATVGRAYLDTIPHSLDFDSSITYLYIVSEGLTECTQSGLYADLQYLKATISTTESEISVDDVTAHTRQIMARAIRPYPPGNLQINGEYFPDLIEGDLLLTWAHRDRARQHLGFTESDSSGPEPGTTYNVRIYDKNDSLIHNASGLTDPFFSYSQLDELDDTGGIGDIYWNSTTLLVDAEGANGSTVLTDSSTSAGAITVSGGSVSTSTDPFGDGLGAWLNASGNYWYLTYVAAKHRWYTSDYTIECWVYATSWTSWSQSTTTPLLIGTQNPSAATAYWAFGPLNDGKLCFYYYNGAQQKVTAAAALSTSTWHHIAMTFDYATGGITLWANGVQVASGTVSGTVQDSYGFLVGGRCFNQALSGRWCDLRITKGVKRYTSTFIPPPARHLTFLPSGYLSDRLRVELEAERDGYESYQKYNVEISRQLDSAWST